VSVFYYGNSSPIGKCLPRSQEPGVRSQNEKETNKVFLRFIEEVSNLIETYTVSILLDSGY